MFAVKRGLLALSLSFAGLTAAWAYPTNLGGILPLAGANAYQDTGAQAAYLTHTGFTNTDATFFLFMEGAGWANNNTFGIYGYDVDSSGNIIVGNMLEVFSGPDAPGFGFPTTATLRWDIGTGTVSNQTTGSVANIGTEFGFYMTTPNAGAYPAQTWYSHGGLNADNSDHMMLFDTSNNYLSALAGSDIVLALDDQDFNIGSDGDFNDMVIGISDVLPVPEPAPIILMASMMIVLLFSFKRRAV